MSVRWMVVASVVALGCSAPPSVKEDKTYSELRGEALGTTWRVVWAAPEEINPSPGILAALGRVDEHMSNWREDSEISVARRADAPTVVSEDTADVVAAALRLAEKTGGAFDPTVGPLMTLWGMHGNPRTTAPSDAEIGETMGAIGYGRVALGRTASGQPTLDVGGTALDLSAIAKGYAVDQVAWEVTKAGASDFMVEIGGEVLVSGEGVSGGLWTLGVDAPVKGAAPGEALAGTVQLGHGAVATSGNYRNYYKLEGVEIHHTLDPRTGRPSTSDVASVTVLAPDCMTADGWATALMVLGSEQGMPLVEANPDLEAWFLVWSDEGWRALRSSGLSGRVATP